MTIEDTNKIDFTTVDKTTGNLSLVIIDHLPWEDTDPEEIARHAWMLQEKLNAYLRFLESGEVYENFPAVQDKRVVVRVVGKFPLNSDGKKFYQRARSVMGRAGFQLNFGRFED